MRVVVDTRLIGLGYVRADRTAVKERRHLVAAHDLAQCADENRGVVSGHRGVRSEQAQQPFEVAALP